MKRIKEKDLNCLVERINKATNSPAAPYTKTKNAVLGPNYQKAVIKANVGNYHLDHASGGVKLVRMVNDGGGVTVVSLDGIGTKRALYDWMGAFLAGINESYCKSCHEEIEQRILTVQAGKRLAEEILEVLDTD